jgi:signal transduction histidine kinase
MQSYEELRVLMDGMLFMMALFSLLSYLQQHKAIYWQYTLYIVCITSTFYLNDQDYKSIEYLPGTSYLITVMESLAFVMYISFAIQLIGIRENDPVSYKVLRGMIVLLAIETIFDAFLFLLPTSNELKSLSYTLFRFLLAAGALWVVPRLFKLRQPVVSYFIVGSLLFIAGCVAALLINYIPAIFTRSPDDPFSFPVTYMELGVVGEVLCFTLGMALLNRENELEKIRVQAQLIEQLRENDKKQQTLLNLRNDIAYDLHDELGADLASISLLSHAASRQVMLQPEQARQSIQQMGDTARKVIRVMREIVWSLHSSHDSSGHFELRLRETAHAIFEHHSTQLHFSFEGRELPIPSAIRRDLFLIYKEVLHNASRHAGAGNIYIEFRTDEHNHLHLTIRDDGHGFDASSIYQGHGMHSLQKRAYALGGTLTIHSLPRRGTITSIICPLEQIAVC